MGSLPDQTLAAGDRLLVGSRMIAVSAELATQFQAGDLLAGIAETGEILHIPAVEASLAFDAVTKAVEAFAKLQSISQDAVTVFFENFAKFLEDDETFSPIAEANKSDLVDAKQRGRSTTRLELSNSMRADMIAGLRMWAQTRSSIGEIELAVDRSGLSVEAIRAPLGVVAFVFEGRPNVFADATGVLRSGNSVVFRIGSDALRTAQAIMKHAVQPALNASGLPNDAVVLLESRTHAAGWALFGDGRLALAVARGSGAAVAQLGAIARQSGVPVSLHGTGGAWMIVRPSAASDWIRNCVRWSLDRKVCNTLNVLCLPRGRDAAWDQLIAEAIAEAAQTRGELGVVHLVGDDPGLVAALEAAAVQIESSVESDLSIEWEWETNPELCVVTVDTLSEAMDLFNRYAPNFIVSLLSNDDHEHAEVWQKCNAPFVGNGFTRWVDGQFALDKPELGLSNWQFGRMLARSGVLSGDSVYSVRLRARQSDENLHR